VSKRINKKTQNSQKIKNKPSKKSIQQFKEKLDTSKKHCLSKQKNKQQI